MRLIDIINGPWAITPEMLNEIRSIYAKHMRGEKIDKNILEQLATANGAKKLAAVKGYEVVNGSAIIPIEGIIAKKMNMFMAISGGTSTQFVERDIRQALIDDTVNQIILSIDSPGGAVDGTFDLSNFIFSARGQKPIIAYTDGMMYSAAYAIGSAADVIFISSNATGVGSIGVVAAHEDWSKAEEMMGVKTTEIYAGKYKRMVSQVKPLTEEGRQSIQDEVDYLYSVFVDAVARNRGTTSEDVLARMSTDVKSAFIGRQAIEAGLVDGVATLEEIVNKTAINGLNGFKSPQPPFDKGGRGGIYGSKIQVAGRVEQGETRQSIQTAAGVAAAEITAAEEVIVDIKELKEKYADLYQTIFEEGKKTGIEEGRISGAQTEFGRIKAVSEKSMPGHEALIKDLMFDGKTTGPEAAEKILAAEQKKRAQHLADYRADGKGVQVPVVDGAAEEAAAARKPSADKSLPVEERAKTAWDADEKLRTEFLGFESFLAFFKAEDAGQVKMFRK